MILKYQNKSGNSGVTYYETGEQYIKVWFDSPQGYLYTHEKPGAFHVEHMKALAIAGSGLSTYISRFVKDNYDQTF